MILIIGSKKKAAAALRAYKEIKPTAYNLPLPIGLAALYRGGSRVGVAPLRRAGIGGARRRGERCSLVLGVHKLVLVLGKLVLVLDRLVRVLDKWVSVLGKMVRVPGTMVRVPGTVFVRVVYRVEVRHMRVQVRHTPVQGQQGRRTQALVLGPREGHRSAPPRAARRCTAHSRETAARRSRQWERRTRTSLASWASSSCRKSCLQAGLI